MKADDDRAPVYALMQLAWGHVKTLEGYPELQDVYDLGQSLMPDVMARLCARAFSGDGVSIPPALRFARAVKLTAAVKGKAWDPELDIVNDGDACMLSYIEGGSGMETDRVAADRVYTDISQVLRVRRIGANLLSFFGVQDSSTNSWRQLVSTCEHAFMSVPASDAAKRARLGKAMQRFIRRALGDVGKRLDLVRYSAKHDATGPRSLLPTGKGGALDEFAESVSRIQDDQKRKRSEVADDSAAMISVRLPAEARALALAAALEPGPKRQQPPQRHVTISEEPAAVTKASAGSSSFTHKLELVAKPTRDEKWGKFGIRIDHKAAARWLTDHGVQRPCMCFQFGHASQRARRWASCPHKDDAAHTEAAEGPHAIADGWAKAAAQFVHPDDRHLLQAQ